MPVKRPAQLPGTLENKPVRLWPTVLNALLHLPATAVRVNETDIRIGQKLSDNCPMGRLGIILDCGTPGSPLPCPAGARWDCRIRLASKEQLGTRM